MNTHVRIGAPVHAARRARRFDDARAHHRAVAALAKRARPPLGADVAERLATTSTQLRTIAATLRQADRLPTLNAIARMPAGEQVSAAVAARDRWRLNRKILKDRHEASFSRQREPCRTRAALGVHVGLLAAHSLPSSLPSSSRRVLCSWPRCSARSKCT